MLCCGRLAKTSCFTRMIQPRHQPKYERLSCIGSKIRPSIRSLFRTGKSATESRRQPAQLIYAKPSLNQGPRLLHCPEQATPPMRCFKTKNPKHTKSRSNRTSNFDSLDQDVLHKPRSHKITSRSGCGFDFPPAG